jgi:hypothetical protein
MDRDRALRLIREIAINGSWRKTGDEYEWKRALEVIGRIATRAADPVVRLSGSNKSHGEGEGTP